MRGTADASEGSAHDGVDARGRGSSAAAPRQAVLPLLGQLIRPDGATNFAHPAEQDLAHLLTYYGVRWSYEPTSFALTRIGEDRRQEFFTPDFYLPEHRLYIELTTMRQRLVTRKNRKLRRLRELYPAVGIKLLYRRDYLRLVDAYDSADGVESVELGPVLFSAEAIAARVNQLAAEIAVDWSRPAASPPLLLGVGRGSQRFLADLGTALAARGVTFEQDRIDLSRYCMSGRGQRARVRRSPQCELAGRRVLLVEDVVSTGLSLAYLLRWLRRRGAIEVAACTLLSRSAARLLRVPVRYVGFDVADTIVAGYGLSLRQQFRDLPDISAVVTGPSGSPSV